MSQRQKPISKLGQKGSCLDYNQIKGSAFFQKKGSSSPFFSKGLSLFGNSIRGASYYRAQGQTRYWKREVNSRTTLPLPNDIVLCRT